MILAPPGYTDEGDDVLANYEADHRNGCRVTKRRLRCCVGSNAPGTNREWSDEQ